MKKATLVFSILLPLTLLSACTSNKQKDQPNWVEHSQEKYVNQQYLTAVGKSESQVRANEGALANLADIFSLQVQNESKMATQHIKSESVLGFTAESSSSLYRQFKNRVDQVIQGAVVKETWRSPAGEYYALAVLDRAVAEQSLKESIMTLDEETEEMIQYSNVTAPNFILSINALRSARDFQLIRKMANLQLGYIRGTGISNERTIDSIELLIKRRLASLSISAEASTEIDLNGLQSGLSQLGVNVVNESRMQVSASVDLTNPTYLEGWYWLRGSYELTITENGQIISRKRWPVKVSTKQKQLLSARLEDKLSQTIEVYLQQIFSDAPTI